MLQSPWGPWVSPRKVNVTPCIGDWCLSPLRDHEGRSCLQFHMSGESTHRSAQEDEAGNSWKAANAQVPMTVLVAWVTLCRPDKRWEDR